jgi:hypothetical protein
MVGRAREGIWVKELYIMEIGDMCINTTVVNYGTVRG